MRENEWPSGKKVFVLDTNVLVNDPDVIDNLGDNIIVVPIWAIEELDKLKRGGNGKAFSSREISRKMDEYRELGKKRNESVVSGITTKRGGIFIVDYDGVGFGKLPVRLEKINDNRIITIAMKWQKKCNGRKIVIISKDTNLRLKAEACGLEAEDYLRDRVEDLYSGSAEIEIADEHSGFFTDWHRAGFFEEREISDFIDLGFLIANQCCLIRSSGKSVLAIYKKKESRFEIARKTAAKESNNRNGRILPINKEQLLAYHLLMDSRISVVSLVGKAGTGKTLMALLAGYEQLDKFYEQILVYRPNIELGRPMGFLPGDVDEKFEPWKWPIIDNLKIIINKSGNGDYTGKRSEHTEGVFDPAMEFIRNNLVTIQPIAYIRGRTLNKKYVLIDEAQNLTPHEIKTIITRIGKNSKLVVAGDIWQIDNPYLDSKTNGLSYLVEKLKGQELFAHITMVKSERSELAELAADLL